MSTGRLDAVRKIYRSQDGRWYFRFCFVNGGNQVAIYCIDRPSLDGRDPDPNKTHIFSSGKICFVEGREPRSQGEAEELARVWAEYILEYRRTGIAQS